MQKMNKLLYVLRRYIFPRRYWKIEEIERAKDRADFEWKKMFYEGDNKRSK